MTLGGETMDATLIAQRNGVVLRTARAGDLPQVDALAIQCYAPIQASYVGMLGEASHEVVGHQPELTWEERKTGQVRRLFQEHPDWVWVLDRGGTLIGFVTFYLVPARQFWFGGSAHGDLLQQRRRRSNPKIS